MSRHDFTERDLHLALDRELPEDERATYENWLQAHPDMKARAARYQEDVERLRTATASFADEPVPERLRALVTEKGARRRARMVRGWHTAAAAAILLVGLGGGYLVGASGWLRIDPQSVRLAESAIAAHNVYSAEKLHVVEVGADQHEHLVRWLSKRLDIPLVTPDLTKHGFALVGGRLLPQGDQRAAQFMYEDKDGNRVSLYVAPNAIPRDTGFRFVQEGSTRAVFWMERDYGCAVTGSVADARLPTIADDAYKQLLAGMKT